MARKKSILIIGGGMMQVPAITIAKDMGLWTIVSDYNPSAPGMAMADQPLVMSTRDVQGTVREARNIHRNRKISGCLTVGTDASVTVAAVCEALNLPGIHTDAAERATDKIKMRRAFAEARLPSPAFRGVWTLEEAREAVDAIGLPAVIKPSDNMGARGVRKIEKPYELDAAFRDAKSLSTTGGVVVEEYMEGDELSIDMLIDHGRMVFSVVADRIIKHPPYFVETGHILPSSQPLELQHQAVILTLAAAQALGISHGAAKSDIKLTKDGPKLGEIAARLSGGFMSGYTCPYATGVQIIRGAIQLALGDLPGDLASDNHRIAVEHAILPQPGRVEAVSGVEAAWKLDGVKNIFIHVQPGDIVSAPTSNMGKGGNVIVTGATREEALARALAAVEAISIQTKPAQVTSWPDIRAAAASRFGPVCRACKECDGFVCAGQVPGVGGVGTGETFKSNYKAWRQIRLNLRTIHGVKSVDTSLELFGQKLNHPILAAPMTGTATNMGGVIDESEFTRCFIEGMRQAGSIPMVGDGASVNKYQIILDVAARHDGWAIPIFKPRADETELRKRFDMARAAGCPAIGMDIDAAKFVTMTQKGVAVETKSDAQLRDYISYWKGPFILKGVMTPDQAEEASRLGAAAIVVSNHGGRVLDNMPSTAQVLPEIAARIKGRVTVLVDGGIRTGDDALKALALGAQGVLVGRPLMIAAVGAGAEGVSFYTDKMARELNQAMLLTGCGKLGEVTTRVIYGQ